MSLFLGKIHYWLYNKILWMEDLEADIMSWAVEKNVTDEAWINSFRHQFGMPTPKKPLEDIIDTSNIHGWLQQTIQRAEQRQAALITSILNINTEYMENLGQLFAVQGQKAAQDYGASAGTAEEIYNALNDYLVEGMPCDRVDEVISSDKNELKWKTTICLHTRYWDQVQGDVQNFYHLRAAWVGAFVSTLNPQFIYQKLPEGTHKIKRKQG